MERSVAIGVLGEATEREKSMMYRTSLRQKMQGVCITVAVTSDATSEEMTANIRCTSARCKEFLLSLCRFEGPTREQTVSYEQWRAKLRFEADRQPTAARWQGYRSLCHRKHRQLCLLARHRQPCRRHSWRSPAPAGSGGGLQRGIQILTSAAYSGRKRSPQEPCSSSAKERRSRLPLSKPRTL